MLECAAGLCAFRLRCLLRALRLLVVPIVLADLQADVILLRADRSGDSHSTRVGLLTLQSV